MNNKLNEKIEQVNKLINNSDNIVFFGGAGVSTESGIPDFRSKDGLYNQKYMYSPEQILSHSFFVNNTIEFYRFYRDKLNVLKCKPNITHEKLVELENKGKLKAIITQNIDGLHKKAGSKNIYELHGSIYRNYCMKCNKFYDAEKIFESNQEIPRCNCGGIIKPDVVLYQESLNSEILNKSIKSISNADLLIIGGTSLTVYPANGIINYFRGNNIILINKDNIKCDIGNNLIINDSLGTVFSNIRIL